MDKCEASFITVLSSDQGCHHCFSESTVSVWYSSNPACPSAPRETIILLLIHLSLYCSPNQFPMEWDVAKLLLPSCGCRGNRDSVFGGMSVRCGLEVWVLTRTTLVGDNDKSLLSWRWGDVSEGRLPVSLACVSERERVSGREFSSFGL